MGTIQMTKRKTHSPGFKAKVAPPPMQRDAQQQLIGRTVVPLFHDCRASAARAVVILSLSVFIAIGMGHGPRRSFESPARARATRR